MYLTKYTNPLDILPVDTFAALKQIELMQCTLNLSEA